MRKLFAANGASIEFDIHRIGEVKGMPAPDAALDRVRFWALLGADLDRLAFIADAGSIPRYGIELATFLAVMAQGVMGVELLRSTWLEAGFAPFRSSRRWL